VHAPLIIIATYEMAAAIIPTVWMRKLRVTEFRLAQVCTGRK
jgi:hypothetical protein